LKVLIVDDHRLFVDGMCLVLENLDASVQILDAKSYEDALPKISDNPDLDLVLLDLDLPGISDIEALTSIRHQLPSIPVVILSGNQDAGKVQEMLNAGAQGYIVKSTKANSMVQALKLVFSGEIYISPEIISQQINLQASKSEGCIDYVEMPFTSRQHDVLNEMVHGFSNKEIARKLDISESTVRVHVAAILKILNVANRTRAVNVAIQKGWVEMGENGKSI